MYLKDWEVPYLLELVIIHKFYVFRNVTIATGLKNTRNWLDLFLSVLWKRKSMRNGPRAASTLQWWASCRSGYFFLSWSNEQKLIQ